MAAQVTTGVAKAATGTQSQPSFAFTHKLMQLKFKVMKDAALTDLGNVTALKVEQRSDFIIDDAVKRKCYYTKHRVLDCILIDYWPGRDYHSYIPRHERFAIFDHENG